MKKIMRNGLLLMALGSGIGYADSVNDIVFTEGIILTNTTWLITFYTKPGDNIETFTNKDKVIYYEATIGVINPTKKFYGVEIICVDSKDNIVLKGPVKRSLGMDDGNIGEDIVRRVVQTLGLDPKPSVLVSSLGVKSIYNVILF